MDKTKIAVDIFNRNANLYQDKFMDVSLYTDTFDLFCAEIKTKNASILELACGPGNITNYLLKKSPDFKILGIDLSENMISLAKLNNPTAEFELMDCREIGTLKKKYDAIMCGFCLPYLSKEEALKLIQDSATLLSDKGLLYISTMEADYTTSGFKKSSSGEEIYMHFHQENYLVKALHENNFTLLNASRKRYLESDESETVDLILIAQKNSG